MKNLVLKNAVHLALLCMAATAGQAYAQDAPPRCGTTNFDQSRNAFTIINPAANAVNQQCFITVYPRGPAPAEAAQYPGSYLVEGNYLIELSGGGGGGGGGASRDEGGGGGGAGAAPMRTVQYLAPGVYRLTIGTGGAGGGANGGSTKAGNPTSITNAYTGQLVAGFPGAVTWTQQSQRAGDGHGGVAMAGGSNGGSGGDSGYSGPKAEQAAQSGGVSSSSGFSGMPGAAGEEHGRREHGKQQADAGGGGGAGAGNGGKGESAERDSQAGTGNLGGGGGGGRGGERTADAGGHGGDGFIRIAMSAPAPVAMAAAPVAMVAAPAAVGRSESVTTSAPLAARSAKRDRN